jgi:hypothetical protein
MVGRGARDGQCGLPQTIGANRKSALPLTASAALVRCGFRIRGWPP